MLALLNAPPLFGLRQALAQYFAGEGYIYGFESVTDFASTMAAVFAHRARAVLVMGAPVFLMGYAYPFIASLVLRREDTLGRHTGALMACNIARERARQPARGLRSARRVRHGGDARAARGALDGARRGGSAARAARARRACGRSARRRRALLVLFPSNERLWGYLHGAPPERFVLVEERSCVNALVEHGDTQMLHLNAAAQNGYPMMTSTF